ncbi:hypothetical protein T12_3803 [Trichinella patagoniensis]|uniref:Uncharacterized protein n=1 Tax=Trichinella patagoniensis TaxID=990121 RepID=A0A0V0ZEY5_9BILA|nr:hypothetical protein T12_3803 [Trichinella patagoniensis]
MCLPVSMIRSCTSPKSKFTTLLKRKARPVAPVNRVDTSSLRFVKNTSQFVQENSRVPPKCSKKRRPIQTILRNKKNNEKGKFSVHLVRNFNNTHVSQSFDNLFTYKWNIRGAMPHRHGGGQSRISVNTTAKLNKRKSFIIFKPNEKAGIMTQTV